MAFTLSPSARRCFGVWATEWSLGHMLRILCTTIPDTTISPTRSQRLTSINYFTNLVTTYNSPFDRLGIRKYRASVVLYFPKNVRDFLRALV